ncbi:MAG: magnesium protoporphyrin IX methyltransferase [Acidocella sp.]|nr:magnesium protoporphyrin IX methyltransferase [Acidocella sp.]
MSNASYQQRRSEIETYFDRTAMAAWEALTSTAPVSKIRATVRTGRDNMRNMLLSWLPADMSGMRLLDAGCGTGALALQAAARGAEVVAIDLSPQLISIAAERAAASPHATKIAFHAGDMLDKNHGRFDYAVMMDSIIHYNQEDAIHALSQLAARVDCAIFFTFAPRTVLLGTMLSVGKIMPRGDRSPAIIPQSEARLQREVALRPAFARFNVGRTSRITSGFYFSQAMEITAC